MDASNPPGGADPATPDAPGAPAGRGLRTRDLVLRIALAVAALLLVWALSQLILLVFLAALLATVLRGSAEWVGRHTGAPVTLVLGLLVLAGLLTAGGLCYWIGPVLLQQGHDLVGTLGQQITALQAYFRHMPWTRPLAQDLSGREIVGQHLLGPVETVLHVTARVIVALLVLVVTALYLAASPEVYLCGAVRLLPIPAAPAPGRCSSSSPACCGCGWPGSWWTCSPWACWRPAGCCSPGCPCPTRSGCWPGC